MYCSLPVACLLAIGVLQGLPEGHTEACYPVLRPGVDSHRAPPLKDSDSDKREVRPGHANLTLTLACFLCNFVLFLKLLILVHDDELMLAAKQCTSHCDSVLIDLKRQLPALGGPKTTQVCAAAACMCLLVQATRLTQHRDQGFTHCTLTYLVGI